MSRISCMTAQLEFRPLRADLGAQFDGPNFQFSCGLTVHLHKWSHDRKRASAPLLPTTPETLGLAATSPSFERIGGVQLLALEHTPEDWCGDIRFPDAQSRKLAHCGELPPGPRLTP